MIKSKGVVSKAEDFLNVLRSRIIRGFLKQAGNNDHTNLGYFKAGGKKMADFELLFSFWSELTPNCANVSIHNVILHLGLRMIIWKSSFFKQKSFLLDILVEEFKVDYPLSKKCMGFKKGYPIIAEGSIQLCTELNLKKSIDWNVWLAGSQKCNICRSDRHIEVDSVAFDSKWSRNYDELDCLRC